MAARFFALAALCAAVGAAPPSPQRLYTQNAPAHLQQHIYPYDYYVDNQGSQPQLAYYYNQAQQKQANSNHGEHRAPSRLESLEPDSEVELIPGAQQPQQPPQQVPVSPNVPGLVPGQRVFIVHMPVPGLRPGSIGGYQPVYIVAAAPQGNGQYPGNVQYPGQVPFPANVQYQGAVNGYQNAVLLDPSGQAVISPLALGYNQFQQHPVQFIAPQFQSLKGPEVNYQEQPVHYQQAHPAHQASQHAAQEAAQQGSRPVQLSQLIALHSQATNAANNPRTASSGSSQNSEPKRLAQSRESNEKEAEDRRSSTRPAQGQVKP
ncbi:hypothetical protein ABMA27_015625 [Loxostege sticticalis]|uniref:Uncharacterized protein n=1 Tax=Loxostege sticticalis TaxID=481309 RepID=A0ABR3I8H3_LOXSC